MNEVRASFCGTGERSGSGQDSSGRYFEEVKNTLVKFLVTMNVFLVVDYLERFLCRADKFCCTCIKPKTTFCFAGFKFAEKGDIAMFLFDVIDYLPSF